MKRTTFFKTLFFLTITPILALSWIALSWGHGGHDHEVQPSISLPKVLAKVNGEDIPKSSIWNGLTQAVVRYKNKGIPMTQEQEKIAAKKLLQDEINRNLVLEKASKMGIAVSDSKVTEELNVVKKNFPSEKSFLSELKKRQLTLEQFRKELKEDILVDAVFRRELGQGIKISDQQIKDYFEKNPQMFSSPEQRRASIILIKANPKHGSKGEKAAKKKLQKIIDKLNKEGADFEEMARLHSQDSLAKRGGDLGFFTKDRMFGPFADLAFKLNVGDVSEIFRTQHGFQILKVTAKKDAIHGTLEGEKENIRKLLMDWEIQNKSHSYLEKLRKQAKIKIYF